MKIENDLLLTEDLESNGLAVGNVYVQSGKTLLHHGMINNVAVS
jgi:hypothetical protein